MLASTAILIALVILLLLNTIINFVQCLRGLLIKLCKFKTIDFRKKYGDWAVITGCTDGIGKEYAKELAKRNMNLVLISRSLDKLQKTKDEIEKINHNIEFKIIQADLSKGKEELDKVKDQLQNVSPGILVNNVGQLNEYPMYLQEYKEEDLYNILQLNITTLTLMSRMVIKQMKERGKGAIVNMSSAASFTPIPFQSVYSATKSYVNFLSTATRKEYSKYGITIQCLTPFYINTKMVGFSKLLQNNPFVPDAATYSRNAIETLGRLDLTTGYWLHDILLFIMTIIPIPIRQKFVMIFNLRARKNYLIETRKTDEMTGLSE